MAAVNTNSTEVSVSDTMECKRTKEYINIRQFQRKCKKRWGLTTEEIKQRWRSLLGDTAIPKSKDEEGWLTMPALAVFS